jgi:P2 family phage contractile tail tube protein
MAEQIPNAVNNWSLYCGEDSSRDYGVVDIKLPVIKMKTVSVDVAGTGGDLEVPLVGQTEAMECTITGPQATIAALSALLPMGQLLTARASQQVYDTAAGVNVAKQFVVVMRANGSELDLGKLKRGEGMDTSRTFAVDYLKVEVDGVIVTEIDKWNNLFLYNGVDYSADVRAQL